VSLWLPQVTGAHELSWGVRAIKAIGINEREFLHTHASQAEGDPTTQSTATNDREVCRLQPLLIVTGHCRLSAEQFCLGHMHGRWKSWRHEIENRIGRVGGRERAKK
jgi:hypothetical protein